MRRWRRWRITSRTWTYGKLHRLYNVAAFIHIFAFRCKLYPGKYELCVPAVWMEERAQCTRENILFTQKYQFTLYVSKASFCAFFRFARIFSLQLTLSHSSETSHLVVNLNYKASNKATKLLRHAAQFSTSTASTTQSTFPENVIPIISWTGEKMNISRWLSEATTLHLQCM